MIVYRKIKQSKEQLVQIRDSADPVSSNEKHLEEVSNFLNELDEEISKDVCVKSSAKYMKYFAIFIASLLPLMKLLNALMDELGKTLNYFM